MGQSKELPPWKDLQVESDMLTVVLPQEHKVRWEICDCLSLLLSLSLSVALWTRIQSSSRGRGFRALCSLSRDPAGTYPESGLSFSLSGRVKDVRSMDPLERGNGERGNGRSLMDFWTLLSFLPAGSLSALERAPHQSLAPQSPTQRISANSHPQYPAHCEPYAARPSRQKSRW
jgi:hypothetical protein